MPSAKGNRFNCDKFGYSFDIEEALNGEPVSYAGKRVYIGIDLHRAFFAASCVSDGAIVKRCRLPAQSAAVISLITKYFSESDVKTCYEAGYSGFWLDRDLTCGNIKHRRARCLNKGGSKRPGKDPQT